MKNVFANLKIRWFKIRRIRILTTIVPTPNLMLESYFNARRPNLESWFESVFIYHRISNLESKTHFQKINESQIRVSNLKIRKTMLISLKPGNLFFPNCIWSNFEQDQSIFVDSDFAGDFLIKIFTRDLQGKRSTFLLGISLWN